MFVDGNLVASDTPTSLINITSTSGNIGYVGPGVNYFSGSMDELRVWNVAKDSTALVDSRYCEIEPTSPNLMSYFRFNSGVNPEGNNAGITTLVNEVSGAGNAVLTNFSLTGTTSNWIAGAQIYDALYGAKNQTFATGATISDIVLLTPGISSSMVSWYASLQDAIDGTNAIPTSTILTNGSDYFAVLNTSLCSTGAFKVTITIASSASVIANNIENQWSISPNPTNGIVVVSSNQIGSLLQIADATGRIIETIQTSLETTPIDLSSNKNGVYFVSLKGKDGVLMTKKLILNH